MRTADPNPLGDTSGLAMMSAISWAGRVNVSGGGNVETVVTVCTQPRRFGVLGKMAEVSVWHGRRRRFPAFQSLAEPL